MCYYEITSIVHRTGMEERKKKLEGREEVKGKKESGERKREKQNLTRLLIHACCCALTAFNLTKYIRKSKYSKTMLQGGHVSLTLPGRQCLTDVLRYTFYPLLMNAVELSMLPEFIAS